MLTARIAEGDAAPRYERHRPSVQRLASQLAAELPFFVRPAPNPEALVIGTAFNLYDRRGFMPKMCVQREAHMKPSRREGLFRERNVCKYI